MSPDPRYPDAPRHNTFQIGLEFQDFVCHALAREHIILQNTCSKSWQIKVGENLQGFEIKFDERCTETGRLSIEVAEKSKDRPDLPWTPSGIRRNDNSWLYIQGNYKILFVFAKSWLLQQYARREADVQEKYGTIKTFYIPFDEAEQGAARVFRIGTCGPEVSPAPLSLDRSGGNGARPANRVEGPGKLSLAAIRWEMGL